MDALTLPRCSEFAMLLLITSLLAQVCWNWLSIREDWKKRVMKCGSLSVNNPSSVPWWASEWMQLWWGQGEEQTAETSGIVSTMRASHAKGIWKGKQEFRSLCTFSSTYSKSTTDPVISQSNITLCLRCCVSPQFLKSVISLQKLLALCFSLLHQILTTDISLAGIFHLKSIFFFFGKSSKWSVYMFFSYTP